MSWQATAWAIEQPEVKDPITRLVLLCLANYAGADGSNAFPSIERLARDTCLSERAVQYQLRKLVKLMLIRKGNQAIAAAHIQRADRRPTVYDLLLERGAPHAPRQATGCTSEPNGVHIDAPRGAPHAPDPIRDPPLNIKRESARAIPAGSGANPEASKERREEFKRRVRELAQSPFPTSRKRV